MLFRNVLCLFYLMVLIRCHTISKSIAAKEDNIDEVIIDRVNDYPFSNCFNLRHGRVNSKNRKHETEPTPESVANAPETTTRSGDKVTIFPKSNSAKEKTTTMARKTTSEATNGVVAPQIYKFNKESPTINLFKRIQQKIHWRNRTSTKTTKKKKLNKKLKLTTKEDKVERDKRVAMYATPYKEFNHAMGEFRTFKITPKIRTVYENMKSNIYMKNIIDNADNVPKYLVTSLDDSKESTSPAFTFTSNWFPSEIKDEADISSGIANIEEMLNSIKKHALDSISEQSHSVTEMVTNAATETAFDAVPVPRTTPIAKYTVQRNDFDFRDLVALSEYEDENRELFVRFNSENTQTRLPVDAVGNNSECKLEKKIKHALTKAKDTIAGRLHKACDQVKCVTCKVMHKAANGLSDIANKIENSKNVKQVPAAFPEHTTKMGSCQDIATKNGKFKETLSPIPKHAVKIKPSQTQNIASKKEQRQKVEDILDTLEHGLEIKPYQAQDLKTSTQIKAPLPKEQKFHNFYKHIESNSFAKKLIKLTNNQADAKKERIRSTMKSIRDEKNAEDVPYDDYSMLMFYEKALHDKILLTTTTDPGQYNNIKIQRDFKGKISKRDIETLENFNLNETIRKSNDGEGMPDADFNYDSQETIPDKTNSPTEEVYDDGITTKMSGTTLRELATPDTRYIGLTNKIHYNEFVNGFKNYLNFTRDLTQSDHKYSNLIRYQAHRHHNVDDIGKFILRRIPVIPKLGTHSEYQNNIRNKRVSPFETLNESMNIITTKNDGSFFKRHFNLFEKKHNWLLGEEKGFKFYTVKDNKKQVKLDPKIYEDDKRQLAEREGLKFKWKTNIKPGPKQSTPDAYNRPFFNAEKQPDLDVKKLIDTAVDKTISDMYPKSATPSNNCNLNRPDLARTSMTSTPPEVKLTAQGEDSLFNSVSDSLLVEMTPVPSETIHETSGEENFINNVDPNRLQTQITTISKPCKTTHYNDMVSALILHKITSIRISEIEGPALLNKKLNKSSRAVDNYEDGKRFSENVKHRNKRDNKKSNIPKAESVTKSNTSTNIFQDADWNPQQDIKSNKMGYVHLDLMAKTPAQQKKKSKFKKYFEKLKLQKKKNKDKEKKLKENTRKARRSPFKILKNMFKSNVNNYETTESISHKLVKDMEVEQFLEEFMRELPNNSTEEVIYKQFELTESLTMKSRSVISPMFASTTPKTVRSKVKSKGSLSTKTKTIPSPEQYFRSPVPMQPNEFNNFLKDNDLYIPDITSPDTELSQFEENWEKGNHVHSKLMDTRGEYEKNNDASKLLKDIKSSDFTFNRGTITPPEYKKVSILNMNTLKNELHSTIKNTASGYRGEYIEDNEMIGPQLENPNFEDFAKTKRKIMKGSKVNPTKVTEKLNGPDFDITIIDIDDMMSASNSKNLLMTAYTTAAVETAVSQMPKTQIPVYNLAEYSPVDKKVLSKENENYKPSFVTKMNAKYKPIVNSDSVESDFYLKSFGTKVNRKMMTHKGKKQYDKQPYLHNRLLYEKINVEKFIKTLPKQTLSTTDEPVHFTLHEYKHKLSNYDDLKHIERMLKSKSQMNSEAPICSHKLMPKPVAHAYTTQKTSQLHKGNDFFNDDNLKNIEAMLKSKSHMNSEAPIHSHKLVPKPIAHAHTTQKTSQLHKGNDFFNDDDLETLTKQTLGTTDEPVHFTLHEYKHKLSNYDDLKNMERMLKSKSQINSEAPIHSHKIMPKPHMEDDFFGNRPTVQTHMTPGPYAHLHQKFVKQPKRMMFSSRTLKYDVLYYDNDKSFENHHEGYKGSRFRHTTTPSYYAQMNKVSRKTDWKGGNDGHDVIDVDKILRDVLGNRRRRKAMWRKWKTTSNPTDFTDTRETMEQTSMPMRKWFMPILQKIRQNTKTPSSLRSSSDSTSNLILLSSMSSYPSQSIDTTKIDQGTGDQDNFKTKVTEETSLCDREESSILTTEREDTSPYNIEAQYRNWTFHDDYMEEKESQPYTQDEVSVKTTVADMSKLMQEITRIENDMKTRKLLDLQYSATTDLDKLEASIMSDFKKTTTETSNTSKKKMSNITSEKPSKYTKSTTAFTKAAKQKRKKTSKKTTPSTAAHLKKTIKRRLKTVHGTTSSKSRTNQEAYLDTYEVSSKKGSKHATVEPSTSNSVITYKTKKKLTSKPTSNPSGSTISKIKKSTFTASNMKAKPITNKISITVIHPQTTTQKTKKVKNINSRLTKRQTFETDDSTLYTAKNVAALEIIVDLMKASTESTTVGKCKTDKYYDNYHNLSTNSIQVHIALPYQNKNKKRAAEPTKLRKVFSARMSVPVDIEYQVRSIDISDNTYKRCQTYTENNIISPGMYLLVENNKNKQEFSLKPVVRQVTQISTSTVETTSPKNVGRVALYKDYIRSINNQPKQLNQNLCTLDKSKQHSVKKRYADSNHLRNRRLINWDKVRKYFLSNKRVCDCKCVANKTMCKTCAASDAVITELLFEFDNLAQYMNDHCTEIQTYFWLNPSGGRKLRDIVHKIDININDYYKRVKGKCQGRPCNAFDKREIIMPHNINNDDVYIGLPLLDDMEYLAKSLQKAQKLKLVCSEELKNVVDNLVKITMDCTGNNRYKKSESVKKNVYSLDNINVNIICNENSPSVLYSEDSPLPSILTSTSVYDSLPTDFQFLALMNDDVMKKTRNKWKNMFNKINKLHNKKASKRETFLQIDSTTQGSDTESIWREYHIGANETNSDIVTQDVLKQTNRYAVTFVPTTLANCSNNSNSRNEILLQISKNYPKRISRQDIFVTVNALDTKTQINEKVKELLDIFETNIEENTGKSGNILSKIAKATQSIKRETTDSSMPMKDIRLPEKKIETKSIETITSANATLPSEITPLIIKLVATSIDPYSSVVQDKQTSKSTKESLFHKLRNLITPGYSYNTQTPKGKEDSQKEIANNRKVAMNTNVISDITTTNLPTLFIIKDFKSDLKRADCEKLLINVMEYERDKLDSELKKHKKRLNDILNEDDEINTVIVAELDEDLRTTPMRIPKSTITVHKWPINEETGDNGIHETATATSHVDVTTEKTTIEKREIKTMLQTLLQRVKSKHQETGKQPISQPPSKQGNENIQDIFYAPEPLMTQPNLNNKDFYAPEPSMTQPNLNNKDFYVPEPSMTQPNLNNKDYSIMFTTPTQLTIIDMMNENKEVQTHTESSADIITSHQYGTNYTTKDAQESEEVEFTDTEDSTTTSYEANKLTNVTKEKDLIITSPIPKLAAYTYQHDTNNTVKDKQTSVKVDFKTTEDTTTTSNKINKLTNVAEEKVVNNTLAAVKFVDKDRTHSITNPSKTQPMKFKATDANPKNVINHINREENTRDKLTETRNNTNKQDKTVERLNENKPNNKLNMNDHEQNSAEAIFKKVLNNDLNKQRKYLKEACEPKSEVCFCDIGATSKHIVDVRNTLPRKDFEKYLKNVTCYAYKRPPSYFLLEPWKAKIKKHKYQKRRRCNKYFDSVPLEKNLKWDWIRKKRSLLSLKDDEVDGYDVFEKDEKNHYEDEEISFTLLRRANKVQKVNKNHYTAFFKDTHDDFESLYKGEDDIYTAIRKRLKRTAGDMKELSHGLRNLPPLQPMADEVYAMLGERISLDCLHGSRDHQKSDHPVSWASERNDMLDGPNVVTNGHTVLLKKVEARNSGNYTCSQKGKTRTVRLTVVTVPQYHVVFIPMYSCEQGCSYDDLRAMKHLGPLMSRESCTTSQNSNSIQIDEPICMEDRDDGSVHLRATTILTACPQPVVGCSAQCRRDLQCAYALLCAENAPVLHGVKVVVARQAYNKTMVPSYGTNRRLIVTHTLRKKDLRKHMAYHQLAASMYPGNMDIVISCPAGYYLIQKQKICAACPADTYATAGENTCYSCAPGTSSEPGSARCKMSLRRLRRYDWWWYPPCGYAVAAAGLLGVFIVCTVCALIAHVTSRSTVKDRGPTRSVNWVDSRWTWSRRTGMKRCSSTSAGVPTRGEPPSPSAVILARFFRASASSSRATDSQETKFEQWKEKNILPPLPPIDFDLS